MIDAPPAPERRRIRLRGQVQGVGMRPFVWRLARELGVAGYVRNDAGGVEIEAEGPAAALDALVGRIATEAPPLAAIDACESVARPAHGASAFVIAESLDGETATAPAPDVAVCDDCLAELFDPADRRYRYPFVNCTHCGPRYTITRALPYDRASTSMAGFAMCPTCLDEYRAPADRRFHAQPNACPVCGPRVALLDAAGLPAGVADPIAVAVGRLLAGAVVAVKGLGGYHLACDATNAEAVARLRLRKHRDAKPFAVMVAGAESAAAWSFVSDAERATLQSRERPIVLLAKRAGCDTALPGVAPALDRIGVMLPATPLHYLLFHEAAGRPAGAAWLRRAGTLRLVMTSANRGGEPIVRDDDEAMEKLAGIADAYLVHDRAIVARCDDSVVAVDRGAPRFVRRSRGYVPRAIRLPHAGEPVLAVGGALKVTVCVTRGDEAFLSQHLGDLDNAASIEAMEEAAERLCALLGVVPRRIAHDLHPDFAGTRLAGALAGRSGAEPVAVQHHHAHIAAIAAEHGATGRVIGLALDGVGLGSDGAAWGGELLVVDGARYERVGHLVPLRLAGGDRAAREPWRMAAALLDRLGRGEETARRFPGPAASAVAGLIASGAHAPWTTSAGRWFDAVAALLGVCTHAGYEGEAAMRLQALAASHGVAEPLAGGACIDGAGALDLLPLAGWLADAGAEPARAAAVFHATLADGLARWAERAARSHATSVVALGGGCWLNAILSAAVVHRLERAGLRVLEARRAPPNDGGLALGQAWIALAGAR